MTAQRVLEGLDGARRAAWAKYFETNTLLLQLMATVRVADNMLAFGQVGLAHNLLSNVHTWATEHELRLPDGDRERIDLFVDTAVAAAPTLPGGRRLGKVGWPTMEGHCA